MADTAALMQGTIPAWKMPRQALRNADKSARLLFNEEVAQEIAKRGSLLQQMQAGM